MLKNVELEWKVLVLACVLLAAFAWPMNWLFVSRLESVLQQSSDPQLQPLLHAQLRTAQGSQRDSLVASIERDRQWQALVPMFVAEQRYAVLSLSVLLFVVLSVLAFWSLQRLTRPLRNLARAVKAIGRGERAQVRVTSGGALGTVEAAVATLQDELGVLREQARVQGMETAWRDIARVMAHEIKNPLTPIRLSLDRMGEKAAAGSGMDSASLGAYVERMNEQVDALERLVDQFRSFSREAEAHCVPLSARESVQAVAQTMEGRLRTQVHGDAMALADPHLLSQVLLNLWKNALEAGAGRIDVHIEAGRAETRIDIADDGPGIPADKVEQVWLPYVTLKSGGSGLGLAVVKRLVEQMGGSATLSSQCAGPDHGVRVTLRLPTQGTPEEHAHTGH